MNGNSLCYSTLKRLRDQRIISYFDLVLLLDKSIWNLVICLIKLVVLFWYLYLLMQRDFIFWSKIHHKLRQSCQIQFEILLNTKIYVLIFFLSKPWYRTFEMAKAKLIIFISFCADLNISKRGIGLFEMKILINS